MEIIREKWSESTVYKPSYQNLIVTCLTFSLHKTSRESSGGIELLLVIYLQWKKVHVLFCFLGACHGGKKHCATHLNYGRAICLLGQFSSLNLNGTSVCELDCFLYNIHNLY